jgi:chemotaxis protein methyltransferase CheR
MRYLLETLDLPQKEFVILRDLIHERTGVVFTDERKDVLADRLSPLVLEKGCNSFLDYYYLLKYGEKTDGEWRSVQDAIAVSETYFWREIDQVRALVDVLMPKLVAAAGCRPVRIWSAACSTGEEPLTIAMALQEAGWWERAAIEIHASDASQNSIDKAKNGIYRERAFRNLPAPLRNTYFQPHGADWRVDPALHERVHWSVANLMAESEVSELANASVVFCRNVFIYFSEQTIRKVVNMLSERMPSPGCLFVGASESLLRLTTDFELQEIGGACGYVKR